MKTLQHLVLTLAMPFILVGCGANAGPGNIAPASLLAVSSTPAKANAAPAARTAGAQPDGTAFIREIYSQKDFDILFFSPAAIALGDGSPATDTHGLTWKDAYYEQPGWYSPHCIPAGTDAYGYQWLFPGAALSVPRTDPIQQVRCFNTRLEADWLTPAFAPNVGIINFASFRKNETWYVRRIFEIGQFEQVTKASLQYRVDNLAELYVNGVRISLPPPAWSNNGYYVYTLDDIASIRTPGLYVLAWKVTDTDDSSHAGLTYDLTLSGFPISFEGGISGWTTWANCLTSNQWEASQYDTRNDSPAPGGGNYALRLHTTGFQNCAYPGVYAQSPTFTASAGVSYDVTNISRNSGAFGETLIAFVNASGQILAQHAVTWNTDVWKYNADPKLTTPPAPAGTVGMWVRYGLRSPNSYADLDLLDVHPHQPESFENGVTGWIFWPNCAADGASWAGQYDTRNDSPAVGGGNFALRLHTTAFTPNCAYPGVYALSPTYAASPGVAYDVSSVSRNGNSTGEIVIGFENAAGQILMQHAIAWNSDLWAYNADSTTTPAAPAGTVRMWVRYSLSTPSTTADLDLLDVHPH